jgi:hypothetical protein
MQRRNALGNERQRKIRTGSALYGLCSKREREKQGVGADGVRDENQTWPVPTAVPESRSSRTKIDPGAEKKRPTFAAHRRRRKMFGTENPGRTKRKTVTGALWPLGNSVTQEGIRRVDRARMNEKAGHGQLAAASKLRLDPTRGRGNLKKNHWRTSRIEIRLAKWITGRQTDAGQDSREKAKPDAQPSAEGKQQG